MTEIYNLCEVRQLLRDKFNIISYGKYFQAMRGDKIVVATKYNILYEIYKIDDAKVEIISHMQELLYNQNIRSKHGEQLLLNLLA